MGSAVPELADRGVFVSWLQISFVVNADQVESLSDVLEGLLAQAVTTQNAGKDEFYEVAFPGTPDWEKVVVTALFDRNIDHAEIVKFVHRQFSAQSADEIPTTVEVLQDQDWERIWLSSFSPVEVGQNLWVCPSWCEPVDKTARNIILDPGLAFGTGTHPTTAMCLNWLSKQDLSTQSVLDYGSGSGILAIAALMSGADSAYAVDIDPLAVTAAADNGLLNGVGNKLSSCLPNELQPQKFPLVIANILADVILELRETLLLHLEVGGTILLTGILSEQSERVKAAFAESLVFEEANSEQWSLLVGRRLK